MIRVYHINCCGRMESPEDRRFGKGDFNEGNKAHQNAEQCKPEGISSKGRLRRVPGFLPVSLQDLLHRC